MELSSTMAQPLNTRSETNIAVFSIPVMDFPKRVKGKIIVKILTLNKVVWVVKMVKGKLVRNNTAVMHRHQHHRVDIIQRRAPPRRHQQTQC